MHYALVQRRGHLTLTSGRPTGAVATVEIVCLPDGFNGETYAEIEKARIGDNLTGTGTGGTAFFALLEAINQAMGLDGQFLTSLLVSIDVETWVWTVMAGVEVDGMQCAGRFCSRTGADETAMASAYLNGLAEIRAKQAVAAEAIAA